MAGFLKKWFGKKEAEKKSSKQAPAKADNRTSKAGHHKSQRKGELGEFKINIQLDQLPKDYKYLSDIMIENPKSRTGWSQIDHIVITPYGLIIMETKNYAGEIKGGKQDKHWNVNNKFHMMNPFFQNYGHLEAVKSSLDITKDKKLFSIVSFTRRCTFKVDPELRDMKADQFIVYDTELSECIHRKMNVEKLLNDAPLYNQEDIQDIYNQLKEANIEDPALRKEHAALMKNGNKKTAEQDNTEKAFCYVCRKPLSEKVKAYCLANPAKFAGKTYCYDHQKNAAKVER
ncbi:nuclease-related domain-containing protein [Salibacterium qingdaonense]|uniref:Nuclease-related domain-containing protein n=1 Tax=Salibacterium qingdaonense TaxID=266892 RepID=A0A1I4NHL1_9BACI|nr:nuclease-related domain-containing protein [Salibacterium qingdaonense]SFM15032.1 Nuclease-related domain-containing protein [Salibacterium qingdaonense]